MTNLIKDGKSYLSDWSELSVSAEKKPKTLIYGTRDEDVSNYLVMAKTKTEEKAAERLPRKKSVSEYPFKFVEKTIRNHLKENFKRNYNSQ